MTTTTVNDRIALIDLDGTVANYDKSMSERQRAIQAPGETPYTGRFAGLIEPPHMEARRKMIQLLPGFWRDLEPIPMGFEVIEEMKTLGFQLAVLTKGPRKTPNAWGEKVEWVCKHLPDALINVSEDKSMVYGRVLFDDFPPYFEKWLEVRPRGLVICLAHPWNEEFKKGGLREHPNVFRYDGKNRDELRVRLTAAYERKSGTQ